jgi:hypothetical protein
MSEDPPQRRFQENSQTLVRRALAVDHPKLVQHRVCFDTLDARRAYWSSDAVICCHGTIIKKAGTQDAFRRGSYGSPRASAQCAVQGGAVSFFLV